MCFINSAQYVYLEQNETNSTWNNQSCRKYYFQKLSQFSQGNNVVPAAASNIDGCFCNGTWVSSTLEKAYFHQMEPITALNNLSSRNFAIQKQTQFSHGNNVLHAPASNTLGFLSEDTCAFQHS
jgi:hypothetical protein